MSNIDALMMTVYTMISLFVSYQSVRFLSVAPQILIVMSHIAEDVEIDIIEGIILPWFLMQNPEILNNAIDAYNKNESIAAQIYDLTDDDDDDDDDDGGTPIDQRYLAKT